MIRQQKNGYSLVELLVVAPIIVLASIIAFTIIFRGNQAYQYSMAQADASQLLTNSLDRISRVLRSTNVIIAASNNDLTVESYFSPRDSVPDRARYYLSNGKLLVDVTPASGTAPNYTYLASDMKTITLANATNTASQPLFRYYDQNGAMLNSPPTLAAVTVVEITLAVNPKPSVLKNDQSSSTRVQLRNRKTNL